MLQVTEPEMRAAERGPPAHAPEWEPKCSHGLATVLDMATLDQSTVLVHYRSSKPRLPKATSTPTAGSAPGANSALTNKCQQKIQNNLKGETRPQNA